MLWNIISINKFCSYSCNLDGIDSIKLAVIDVECRRRRSESDFTPSGSSSFIGKDIIVLRKPAQIV